MSLADQEYVVDEYVGDVVAEAEADPNGLCGGSGAGGKKWLPSPFHQWLPDAGGCPVYGGNFGRGGMRPGILPGIGPGILPGIGGILPGIGPGMPPGIVPGIDGLKPGGGRGSVARFALANTARGGWSFTYLLGWYQRLGLQPLAVGAIEQAELGCPPYHADALVAWINLVSVHRSQAKPMQIRTF